MKTLFIVLLFASISGCGSSADKQDDSQNSSNVTAVEETSTTSTSSQSSTATTTSSQVQNSMLLGEIEKKDFLSPPFDAWYNRTHDNYEPTPEAMEEIKQGLASVDEIHIFMGTWCPDSRREVPQFFKILEMADYDLENVHMMAVDRRKAAPDNSHETYEITRVPTFIFYKDGEEMNRYVERPRESLEKDVANIVQGREYKDSYSN